MQKTLAKIVEIGGIGLHSGAPALLRLVPAEPDHGIWFQRVDLDGDNLIPARFDHVSDTKLCTRLSNSAGAEVSTVEHLMAALAGTGISNLMIELDGPEVPIMDGSSAEFVAAILEAGVTEQDAMLNVIRVLKPVEISFDNVVVRIEPADNLEIDFAISYQDPAIGDQQKRLNMANGAFVRELSQCRTFGLFGDVEKLRAVGLGRGGSLENAVVVHEGRVLNPEGLRHADECVRHKMLDALGDLYLAGAPVLGRYHGQLAGHKGTNLLLRALFADPDAYEILQCPAEIAGSLPGVGLDHADISA